MVTVGAARDGSVDDDGSDNDIARPYRRSAVAARPREIRPWSSGSPPAGGRPDLTSEFRGHGAHVGGGEVVRITVYQHISLDGPTEVRPAHRITHVERFEARESSDEIQRR